MSSKLVIITPEVSPGTGGVADHTLALIRSWRSNSSLGVLTETPSPATASLVNDAAQLASTRDAIKAQLPPEAGNVFVQYSAYGFNRFGYPRSLIAALVDWKKCPGGHLVVFFHEIWTFWPVTNKNFVIQQFHRRALKRLLGVCDAAFTTTASQAEHLRKLGNAVPIQILPVGSNIRRQTGVPTLRQEGLAVLFGLQANRIRALETMGESLMALTKAGKITKIISIGQGSDPQLSDRERKLLLDLDLSAGFSQEGALSEDKVSGMLSLASFGIFGQNELSCTKSGSFMACAAHQLNVLADFAEPSKAPPVCWLVSPKEVLGGIAQDELDRRAECLRMWQEQNSSWNVIADTLGCALGIETAHRLNP